MEDYLKAAIEITKAQASVRNMTEDEIMTMIQNMAKKFKGMAEGDVESPQSEAAVDPKKSIREKSVVCIECGKVFKVLTKKHLATHDLTPEEYKAKWGLPKGASLVAKSLARERRKKMQDMKLWEKRGKKTVG
ncbi:MAG: transcriptional regulator [Deltaproteobacteria bacterium]|nr:transcriptional regulator [Deltaproteobacteria bacterium]